MGVFFGFRSSIALVAALAVIGGAATAFSALQKTRPPVGEVAFAVQHGDNESPWDIYLVRTDGHWILKKKTPLNEAEPAWSPDGRHIVFRGWSAPTNAPRIYTMNPDGSHRRPLAWGIFPQWSPDGRRILYATGSGLYVMNADGGDRHRVGRGGGGSWSPDGKHIAVSRQSGIDIVDVGGGRERRLAGSDSDLAAWAPGRQIVFTRYDDSGPPVTRIYVVNADGTGLRRIKTVGGYDEPTIGGWSPDGKLILYAGPNGVSTVRPSDGFTRRVTHIYGSEPAWDPSGRAIVFTRTFTRGKGVWIVNRDGSGLRRFVAAKGVDDYYEPAWGKAPKPGRE